MPFLAHLFLIFWKNVYMIQIRRHYLLTLLEIVVPVILAYIFGYGGLVAHSHRDFATLLASGPKGLRAALHEHRIVKNKASPDDVKKRIRETVSKNPVRHTLGALPTVVGFLFMLPVFVKRLCDELTSGAKELMSINGLSESAFWMGSSVGAFFEMFLVQAPLIVLLRSNPLTGAVGLWPHSDVTVLVTFFTVYSAAATCFAIVIAIISPRPNIAGILTFVIMVMTLIPAIIMIVATGASLQDSERVFTTHDYVYRVILLIPNIGFTYGITLICESEELGSIRPSSGTAFVQGQDIRKKKSAVRKTVGYCPQHFSLYREMTVQENLWLFGRVRGMNNKDADEALALILMSLQMNDIRDKLVKRLTTGQRRKVQLGISLIGDPQMLLLDEPTVGCDTDSRNALWHSILKIRGQRGILLATNSIEEADILGDRVAIISAGVMLLLDEPTVGCDTDSRNALWHSILKIRGQRGILLATNSIEEADILGDRVAIISAGVVRCCGSALFLRKKYGIGYRLHMTTTEMPNVKHLVSFVTGIVELARVFLERRGYIIFSLGNPEHTTLIQLLKQIEQNRRSLGVFTLGLAATSLEDVLLKYEPLWDFVPVTGFALLSLQIRALLYKKLCYYKRSYLSIPMLLIFIFMLVVMRTIALGLLPWKGLKELDLAEIQAKVITTNIGQVMQQRDNQSSITYSIETVEDTVTGPMYTTALTARIMDSLILPLLLSLLAAAYIAIPIEETVSKAKMLQLLTGISSTRYWLINFLVDFVTYNIACFAAFLPIYVGDPNNLHGREYTIISRYYFLFAFFGWSFIPTTYVISSSVETPTVAYFALIVESFITGTVTSIVLFLFAKDLVIKQAERGNYHKLITKLEFPMRMVPNFAVNRGFGAINRELISQLICCNFPLDLQVFLCRHSRGEHVHIIFSQNETEYWDRLAKSCPNICEHSERHIAQSDDCYFDRFLPPQVISDNNWDLVVMGITGLVLLAVTIFFDAKFPSKTKSHELMSREELRLKRAQVHLLDPTVIEERDRVEDLVQAMVHGEEDGLLGLLVHKLGKTYGDTNIINQLSFTVQPGEIFGVLGLQQSGRSTVLGILAGDRELGRGNAYIEGWGIRRNPKQVSGYGLIWFASLGLLYDL
ncbi:ABC transporter, putative [Ixodes scapularis]|uniref:ABC transporter, putative n=1 Tax=Ixodes scapularis TaxID=6945 RepID=B7PPH8_IXOSC|nr:ABC transporter, putative [Ixodes scapularis]|eukprot:XP_002435670.1 ABC transporter, putative [Ixodes scapularis]